MEVICDLGVRQLVLLLSFDNYEHNFLPAFFRPKHL